MKKGICLMCLFILLSIPIIAHADGYMENDKIGTQQQQQQLDQSNESDSNIGELLEDGNERIQQYRSNVQRQEVKTGNQKQGNSMPLILTLIAMMIAGGGYYYYQKRKA